MVVAFAGAVVIALAGTACTRGTPPQTRPEADTLQIGYEGQPKGKLLGAVSSISEDQVTGPLRIEQLLRGKVPGLVIEGSGNTLTLRMRGTNSMGLEQEPLVIVDDVMIQSGNIANALAGLTPDDITQVSVLKDVASTSIYGMRGAGGVILIKTKAKPDSGDGKR